MKRFLSKSKGSKATSKDRPLSEIRVLNATIHPVKSVIPPKYAATAIPHPHPFERIVVHATIDGLFLRPDTGDFESGVKVSWGRDGSVTTVSSDDEQLSTVTWQGAVAVYGIVGIMRLFDRKHGVPSSLLYSDL